MPVYLIRHGQSEFNAAEHHEKDPLIFDAPLTKLGEAQADRVRENIADLGIKHVISSPLTRAIQTALRIFDEIAPITIEATHRENLAHSCDVGRPPQELAGDFPMLRFDHLDDHWWHKGPANEDNVPVEPTAVFHSRVREFDKVLAVTSARPIAIVGHGDYFKKMIGHMLDNCEVASYQPAGLE